MQPLSDTVTDIWFRTPADLDAICAALGLSEVVDDAEDTWAWVDATMDGVRVRLACVHDMPWESNDIRLSLQQVEPFPDALRAKAVQRLRTIARGRVSWGRCKRVNHRDFEWEVVGDVAADG